MDRCGVIFDMDGVLVDSYRAHFESWRRLTCSHGVTITEQQFASTFGQTNQYIIPLFWGEQAGEDWPEWADEKEALFRQILREDFPEMDGAGELLAALDEAGFVLAIGSSAPPENVEAALGSLSNGNLFAATVNASEVALGKPNPQVFLTAAEKIGIGPDRCAVVEDAPAGLEAAKAAGMAAIALTGSAPRERLAERADLVVDSLRDLSPGRIAELLAAGAS